VWKHVAAALGIVVAALPLSVMATLAMIPVWRWLEASTGFESIGHSGPATWCFVVVFAVMLMALTSVYVAYVPRGRARADGKG